MVGKNQHVVPYKDDWAVRGEKNSKVTSIHENKSQAINAAIEIAQRNQSEVVIHRKDGVIQDKDSYGRDPKQIKDRKH